MGAMGEQFFDDLARGLDDGTISRRRALKFVGGALLASMASPLFPREADAISARRRCRRKRGIFVPPATSSGCRCAAKCNSDPSKFTCHSNKNCSCNETTEGTGFCAENESLLFNGCSPADGVNCPTGYTCVVNRGCVGSGGSCTTRTDCPTPAYGCINGRCQQTFCIAACPT